MGNNDTKAAALGMPIGTAANRLRKMVLFSLLVRLRENFCYRCGSEILSVADLSIEHKEAWLRAENPVDAFFDLDNIAFSHLSCNSAAASQPNKVYKTEKLRLRAKEQRRLAKIGGPEERRVARRARYLKYGC